jgi:hypothetical protein
LRRLIDADPNAAGRIRDLVNVDLATLRDLAGKSDTERAFALSMMGARSGGPEAANRMQKLLEKPPEEWEAALTKEYETLQLDSITSIFKTQFNSMVMRNLKNIEEASKK